MFCVIHVELRPENSKVCAPIHGVFTASVLLRVILACRQHRDWAIFILQHIHERRQQLVHALAIGLRSWCARCFGCVLGVRVFQRPDRQYVRQ